MKTSFVHKGLALILALSLTALSACGSSATSTTSDAAASVKSSAEAAASTTTESAAAEAETETETEVRTVVIGYGNDYNPNCYVDDDGNPAGQEYAIWQAIDELLPQYEFEFSPADFSSILVGLDTGKYDIGSHWFGYNEDRAAKYLYATQPYNVTSYHIAVLEDDTTEYTNIDSLAGKTVFVSPGGNVANMLETYNETAETPINLYYGEQDNQIIISALTSGLVDAFISDDLSLYRWNQEYDTKVKGVGDALARTGTFFLFRQGEEELRDAVNGALEELVSDGTISKIATEYFGLDISATLDDAIEVG